MTLKIIELKQAPVVLVEFPEGTNPYSEITRKEMHSIDIPTNSLIGVLSDLNEDQFAECVDSWESVWNDGSKVYENYKDPVPKKRTAEDSFYSLLESEKVYTENPYGEKAPVNSEFYWGYLNDFEQWQEAQSRTIDPKRTVVLVKKED